MADGNRSVEKVGDHTSTPKVVRQHVVMNQWCCEHRTRPTITNLGRELLGLSEARRTKLEPDNGPPTPEILGINAREHRRSPWDRLRRGERGNSEGLYE